MFKSSYAFLKLVTSKVEVLSYNPNSRNLFFFLSWKKSNKTGNVKPKHPEKEVQVFFEHNLKIDRLL